MKKNLLPLLVVILFSSCSKTPENVKVIPNNSYAVMKIDMVDLLFKANMLELQKHPIFEEIEASLKGGAKSKSQQQLVTALIENPFSSGVDFMRPVYSFMNSSADENTIYACTALELSSKSNFEDLLAKVDDVEVKQEAGISYVELRSDLILAWNDKVALFLTNKVRLTEPVSMVESAVKVLTASTEDNFYKNENFNEFVESESEIGLYLNGSVYATYVRELQKMMAAFGGKSDTALLEKAVQYENSFMAFDLFFNDDDVELLTTTHFTKELTKLKDVHQESIDNTYLGKLTDKELIAVVGFAVRPEEVLRVLETEEVYGTIFGEIEKESGLTKADFLATFDGQFVGGFSGMEEIVLQRDTAGKAQMEQGLAELLAKEDLSMSDEMAIEIYEDELQQFEQSAYTKVMPIFSGCIGLKDAAKASELLATKGTLTDGIYSSEGLVYAVVKDDYLFLSNNLAYAKTIKDAGVLKPYTNEKVNELFSSNPMVFNVDLDIENYPGEFKKLAMKELGVEVREFVKLFESADAYGSSAQSVFRLNLHEGNGNSLYRIILSVIDKSTENENPA